MKPLSPSIAVVKWHDAYSPSATEVYSTESPPPDKDIPIHTVGWLLRHNERGVTIAGEYCGEGDYRSLTFIPTALVVSVTPVTVSRSRPRRTLSPPLPAPEKV